MASARVREAFEELRSVLGKRGGLTDAIIPPLAFVVANALLDLQTALWIAAGLAAVLVAYRLVRRQPWRYALGGIAAVAVAAALALLLGRAEGFFLPGIVTSGITVVLCLGSVLARRPLVAWTSYASRRWPLGWYESVGNQQLVTKSTACHCEEWSDEAIWGPLAA